jgi:hypothetical protein
VKSSTRRCFSHSLPSRSRSDESVSPPLSRYLLSRIPPYDFTSQVEMVLLADGMFSHL